MNKRLLKYFLFMSVAVLLEFMVTKTGYGANVDIAGVWKAKLTYTVEEKPEVNEAKLNIIQEDNKLKGSMTLFVKERKDEESSEEIEAEDAWNIEEVNIGDEGRISLTMRADDDAILKADLKLVDKMEGNFYIIDSEKNIFSGTFTAEKE